VPRLCCGLSKPDWDKGRSYLATNQEKYRTAYLLDQMGFGRQFDGIFSSAYVGYVSYRVRLSGTGLHLGSTATQHIWQDVLLWLLCPMHRG